MFRRHTLTSWRVTSATYIDLTYYTLTRHCYYFQKTVKSCILGSIKCAPTGRVYPPKDKGVILRVKEWGGLIVPIPSAPTSMVVKCGVQLSGSVVVTQSVRASLTLNKSRVLLRETDINSQYSTYIRRENTAAMKRIRIEQSADCGAPW